MKTKILLMMVLFISAIALGQIRNPIKIVKNPVESKITISPEMMEKMTPEQQEMYMQRYNRNNPQTKSSQSLNTLWAQIPLSADGCLNGGFEQDYTGWTGLKLKHSIQTLPIENGITPDGGIVALPYTNPAWGQHQTFINTAGNDAFLAAANPAVTLSKIPFGGGAKSIRLGNDQAGYSAEAIAKKFVVTSANKIYYFKYATVMDKSHSNQDGSKNGSEVFFFAEAIDANTGASLASYDDVGNPSNPNIQSTITSGNQTTYYRNWTCKSLDLSDNVGKTVIVYFMNSDCQYSGHNGYTYIDDVCKPCEDIDLGHVDINLNIENKNCIEFPLSITGSYGMPDNSFQRTLTFEIYKNGNPTPVKTINGSTISSSTQLNGGTGNINFSIQPTHFTGLNTSSGQGYDIVAVLTFKQTNILGQTISFTKRTSDVVNNVQDGEVSGLNNDIKFCKPDVPPMPNCCKEEIKVDSKNAKIYRYKNGIAALDNFYIASSNTIIKATVSIVSLSISGSKGCNGFSTPQGDGLITDNTSTSINGLQLNNSNLGNGDWVNQGELTWQNPNGANLSNGASFDLNYLLPTPLNSKECEYEVKVCFKIQLTDKECNVCEKIICKTIKMDSKRLSSIR